MDSEKKRQINLPLIIFIIVQIIIIAILTFIVSSTSKSDNITVETNRLPDASIDNLRSSIPNISAEQAKNIELALFAVMRENSNTQDFANSSAKASIIEDTISLVHFENRKGNLFSAVINAPDLNQSYDLYYGYPDDNNGDFQGFISILCPARKESKIYPNFDCKDTSSLNPSQLSIVESFLPYMSFNYFSVSINSQEDNTEIQIYPTQFDLDDTTKKSYIEQTKQAVNSLGVSPDLFSYRFMNFQDYDYTNPFR